MKFTVEDIGQVSSLRITKFAMECMIVLIVLMNQAATMITQEA